jgi:hypothetical protein
MKRVIIFFGLLGAGFFYLFLALINLRLESENNQLREKKILLERDRKLIMLEISQRSSVKNLELAYLPFGDSLKDLPNFSTTQEFGNRLFSFSGEKILSVIKEKETKSSWGWNETFPFVSVSQRNR